MTFLGVPARSTPDAEAVSIMGAVHGTPYGKALAQDLVGPDRVREGVWLGPDTLQHWDFDWDGPLLGTSQIAVNDLGNIRTRHDAAAANRQAIEEVTRSVLDAKGTPILIGGDDSVAIPFMAAFAERGPLHLLQIDAHLDWRDTVDGERLGLSSTMRRASELPDIKTITQVGLRGMGSARAEEIEAARSWGADLVPWRSAQARGAADIAASLPFEGSVLIHIDCDAFDPAVCPAVNSPAPGGFSLGEVTALIGAALHGRRLAGLSVVEYAPERDRDGISAAVIGRLICHVLALLARTR